ncbi:hypothetical protein [Algoriphagus sp.]|uniref:hypothetical protein n=1 Tax=Algoriphagus sp. TaxID=1872435 RepID=UPI00263561F8|nr:hypothetical protein [Algoriphagus sp.]
MSKNQLILFISILGFLILTNIFSGYINALTEGIGTHDLYQTPNAEFQFTSIPSKGRGINMMKEQFSNFKKENPHYSDLTLYRTCKRNPLKFWNWHNYLTHKKYEFPYLKETLDN